MAMNVLALWKALNDYSDGKRVYCCDDDGNFYEAYKLSEDDDGDAVIEIIKM